MNQKQAPKKSRMRWLPLFLSIALGILLGAGRFTFQFAEGLSYLSNGPKTCVNCHVMREQYEFWPRASHHSAATCNDCHVPHTFPEKYLVKAFNGWNHSKAFTLQNFPQAIRIRSLSLKGPQHNCIKCHEVAVNEIAAHADVQKGTARCSNCQRSVGHTATY